MMFLWIILIAVLFYLVLYNNKRNMNKLRNRKRRSFRDKYYEKKEKK